MIDYKQLDVWIASRQLANSIYTISKNFPKDEIFGLTQQIRKSAISVPSNIAEGLGRNHLNEIIQFLYIARGSLFELETQIYIAFDQGYLESDNLKQITDTIEKCKKLLNGFINYYLKKKTKN
ncbi:MAG: four helix bundle protein [Tenuifilum sp.]|uniref:four helix bundle protein n=1 Tax=Tenuifilum sp. TaxID=2760880 RepID=UPI003CA61AAF